MVAVRRLWRRRPGPAGRRWGRGRARSIAAAAVGVVGLAAVGLALLQRRGRQSSAALPSLHSLSGCTRRSCCALPIKFLSYKSTYE